MSIFTDTRHHLHIIYQSLKRGLLGAEASYKTPLSLLPHQVQDEEGCVHAGVGTLRHGLTHINLEIYHTIKRLSSCQPVILVILINH